MAFDSVESALEAFQSRHPRKIDLSLGRLEQVLSRLGDPHKNLPPIIHVAGTNGKGSTIAFMRAMLEAAGHSVHVYTSPHLVRFHERIRLAGKLIDDGMLKDVLWQVDAAAGDEPITFFEATTAAAFLAFSQVPADALILEVGLGGRLDATNVIDRPAVSVITPVSVDHVEFLGDTVSQIAGEKAGIARKDTPLVSHQTHEDAAKKIDVAARKKGAHPVASGNHFTADITVDGIDYKDAKGALTLPLPSLPGGFQAWNAILATAALRHQTVWSVPEASLSAGVRWASWPARLQLLSTGKLLRLLPKESQLWLDGGHNAAAGAQVANFVKSLKAKRDAPVHVVLGMLSNKDLASYLSPFGGLLDSLWGLPIDGHDHHAPASIAAFGQELGIPGRLGGPDVISALKHITAVSDDGPPPYVFVLGSLYMAGEVLRLNETLPD
ncbi:MAG: folylpolyglutamate synthase/dihydrofolate synthase family protein [Pseudomonadota bacterium]